MAKVKVFGNVFKSGKEARNIFEISYSATNKLMRNNDLTQGEAIERLVSSERFTNFKTAEIVKEIFDNILVKLPDAERNYLTKPEQKPKKTVVRRVFSDVEKKLIATEVKNGTPVRVIAAAVGRRPETVYNKIRDMKKKGEI